MKLGRVLAWLLLASGAAGFAAAAQWSWMAALGIACGVLLLRGMTVGLWGGLLYSALQSLRYFPYAGSGAFGSKWTLSLAVVMHVPDGVLVVNVLSVAMGLACAGLLVWRHRECGSG